MSADVLPSDTIARTPGWRASRAESRRGSSHRAVVPRMPRRTSPVTSPSTGRHVGGDVLHLAQDPPGPVDDAGAVLGEPALGAVDERRAELALQAGDVAGHVGLHREQGPGGGRERAVVGDRHQGGELADVHLPRR